jgi:hypothetical protein
MENLIFFLATSFALRFSPKRKSKNSFIEKTGCSVLLPSKNSFKSITTASGDQLHFNKYFEKGVTYGIICIQLNRHYEMKQAVSLLARYINKLKRSFYVLHNTGLQAGTDWNSPLSKSIVDYWQDEDQKDWKVKGYTDGSTMAILYVKNITQIEVRQQDLFLDSFHFKAAS